MLVCCPIDTHDKAVSVCTGLVLDCTIVSGVWSPRPVCVHSQEARRSWRCVRASPSLSSARCASSSGPSGGSPAPHRPPTWVRRRSARWGPVRGRGPGGWSLGSAPRARARTTRASTRAPTTGPARRCACGCCRPARPALLSTLSQHGPVPLAAAQ